MAWRLVRVVAMLVSIGGCNMAEFLLFLNGFFWMFVFIVLLVMATISSIRNGGE